MSIMLRLPGVTATAPLLGALPSVDEAVFAFLRESQAISFNRTPGGAALSHISSGPTYNANDATLTPFTNAIVTPVQYLYTGMTFMAVWRRVSGGTGAYTRIFYADVEPDVHGYPRFQYNVGTSSFNLSGTYPSTATATLAVSDDYDTYRFIAGTIGGSVPTKIYNMTDGTSSSDGGTGDTWVHDEGELVTLCSGVSGGPTRASRVPWFGIATEVLSEAEIEQYYDHVKWQLNRISSGAIVC